MSSHLFSPCQSFPIYLYFHLSNNAKNSPQKSGISFPLSTMINIHRFCQMLTGFSLFNTEKAQWPWMWITLSTLWLQSLKTEFQTSQMTFLLNAAEPLQWECVWSPGDVSLVIVNLSPLFSAGCCEGKRVLRLWEALPFPLISPCGTCMNTAASTCKPSAKWERYLLLGEGA